MPSQNVAVPDYSGTVWATRPYGCVARWAWEWLGFLVDDKKERDLDPAHLTGALAVVVWAECGSRFKKAPGAASLMEGRPGWPGRRDNAMRPPSSYPLWNVAILSCAGSNVIDYGSASLVVGIWKRRLRVRRCLDG